jgi:antitoxin component YwqK of YwqJK toxin-antitoxin module
MKRYFIPLIIIIVVYGQDTKQVITERHNNRTKKLVLEYKGEGIDEELVTKYGFYENGMKEFVEEYENNLLVAKYGYYGNGLKEFIEEYKNNLKDGLNANWYKNGQKKSEGNYKNGKMNGEWTYYWKNGGIKGKGSFKDGNGIDISKVSGIHNNGRNGDWITYYEDGNKWQSLTYNNGLLDGEFIWWYRNGQKKIQDTFKDGKRNGLFTEYYENGSGNIRKIYQYKDGLADGMQNSFWENGNKFSQSEYLGGNWVSLVLYYPNGQKKISGKIGEKWKKWEGFNENGSRMKKKVLKKHMIELGVTTSNTTKLLRAIKTIDEVLPK